MKNLRLVTMLALALCLSMAQQALAYDQPERAHFSTRTFGKDLARAVARKLDSMSGNDKGMFSIHDGDNGAAIVKNPSWIQVFTFDPATNESTAIQRQEGIYVGDMREAGQLTIKSGQYFATSSEFANWLAKQSEASLARCQWDFCKFQAFTFESLETFAYGN